MRLGPGVSVSVDSGGGTVSDVGFGIRRIQNVNSIFMSDILNNLCDLIFGLHSN